MTVIADKVKTEEKRMEHCTLRNKDTKKNIRNNNNC